MKSKEMIYRELELIPSPESTPKVNSSKLLAVLGRIGNLLTKLLTPSNEPKIWLSKNCYGGIQWNAYDPITGRQASLMSEDEVRTWLEQRYY